ncbi:hypothetical protein EDB89DRAFT_2072059 [Lactarius sanguifluus]|nr:hypothetical protein EDB89DRAFT_2072059 [Lactarius sanguifluus]
MPVRIRLPGSTYISCLAWLENPRVVDEIWGYIVFDALISSSVTVDDSDRVIGSLRYEAKGPVEALTAGLYHIHAKVVTFEPNTHAQSPVRGDQEFAFMGDIFELRAVSNTENQTLCTTDHPARMFAFGRVSGLDREINMLTLSVWQIINEHSSVAHLTVRGVLGINALSNNRANRLPPLNSVVSLTGDIMTLEDGVAVVALDDLRECTRLDGWLRAFWFEEDGASCARLAIRDNAWLPNNDFSTVTMWLFWFLLRPGASHPPPLLDAHN